MSFITARPVVFWGLLTTLFESVYGAILIFGGIEVTPEETGAILLVVAAIGGVFTFLVQGKVTPTNNPKDDAGNMLTPGTIGSDEADLPPI